MKNQKPSFIVLTLSLVLSVIFLVILTLGLFGILVPSWLTGIKFNFLFAYCLIIINLVLDMLFMIIEKKKLLVIPEWFRVVFFIGFFIFTNVYYYFGLYNIIYTQVLAYIYLAFVLSVLSISIFYNVQKSDKNVVKQSNKFAAVSTFTYSTSMFLLVEIVITVLKTAINGANVANGLVIFLIHACVAVFVSLLVSIIFYFSLVKTKKLVNACLIKVNAPAKQEEMENQK